MYICENFCFLVLPMLSRGIKCALVTQKLQQITMLIDLYVFVLNGFVFAKVKATLSIIITFYTIECFVQIKLNCTMATWSHLNGKYSLGKTLNDINLPLKWFSLSCCHPMLNVHSRGLKIDIISNNFMFIGKTQPRVLCCTFPLKMLRLCFSGIFSFYWNTDNFLSC